MRLDARKARPLPRESAHAATPRQRSGAPSVLRVALFFANIDLGIERPARLARAWIERDHRLNGEHRYSASSKRMGVAWNDVALIAPEPSETSPVWYSHATASRSTLRGVICVRRE
jgi:hypothetical protein